MKKIGMLTMEEIDKLITVFRERQAVLQREFALAVTDGHGELIFFIRTDNCPQSSVGIAMNKAYTAARDRQKTSSLSKVANELGFAVSSLGDLRYTDLGGGVPIVVDGEYIGAVAVSGMAQEEDEALAEELIEGMLS